MTTMYEQLGQRGDTAAASVILEAHRRCSDCVAGRCEAGRWAARLLAAHRQDRAAALAR